MPDSFSEELKTVPIESDCYPDLLKKIPNAPPVLYVKGALLKNEVCFAIVGTRRCSDYGKEVAFSISQNLASSGLTIVSGMARGIDTFAHQGALEARGRTIAVLGTGLDEKSIYPQENLKLAREILAKGGCLVSEYPEGTRATQFTFPKRNRLISGLSLGVLVVEAKFGSGALITADWARKQGRKIFAVPGQVHSLNSKGPHHLIKKGAKLVENANDILKELNLPSLTKTAGQPAGKNEEEILILKALSEENFHIDKIIEKTKLSPQQVSAALSLMEIENKVKNLGGNVYALMR